MASRSLFSSLPPGEELRVSRRSTVADLPLFQEPVYPPGTVQPVDDEPDDNRTPPGFTATWEAGTLPRAAGEGKRPTASRTGRAGRTVRGR